MLSNFLFQKSAELIWTEAQEAKNRKTYKSSLIVDGFPNWVAVDRSKLKHIIQTLVLFKISRSWFSDVGFVVET